MLSSLCIHQYLNKKCEVSIITANVDLMCMSYKNSERKRFSEQSSLSCSVQISMSIFVRNLIVVYKHYISYLHNFWYHHLGIQEGTGNCCLQFPVCIKEMNSKLNHSQRKLGRMGYTNLTCRECHSISGILPAPTILNPALTRPNCCKWNSGNHYIILKKQQPIKQEPSKSLINSYLFIYFLIGKKSKSGKEIRGKEQKRPVQKQWSPNHALQPRIFQS